MSRASQRVLLSLPTGIAARNFFQSGLVDALLALPEVELSIVCPDKTEKIYESWTNKGVIFRRDLHRKNNIIFRLMLYVQRRRFYRVKPTKSSEIIRRAPLFRSFGHILGPLFSHPFPRSALVLRALEGLCFCLGKLWYGALGRKVKAGFDTVILSHPTDSKEFYLKMAAKSAKLKTVGCIKSFDNLSTKGYIFPIDDHYLVWNQIMLEELGNLHGINADRVSVIGVLQFDSYFRQGGYSSPLCDTGKQKKPLRVLYAGSPPMITPDDPNIVAALSARFEQHEIDLRVRLHQMDDAARWSSNSDVKFSSGSPSVGPTFEKIAASKHISELHEDLAWADVVIVTCSTMMLDATCMSKPVINVGFNYPIKRPYSASVSRFYEFDHYAEVMRSPLCNFTTTIDELLDYLADINQLNSKVLEFREDLLDRYVPFRDGGTAGRFVDAVRKLH